ncbi:hypothetical protein Trydic_g20218 [Trypoxylus dichotomus]
MSTKLRFKVQERQKCDSSMKQSLRHTYVGEKKQREVKSRRRGTLAKKTRPNSSRLPDRNVIDVIKSLSGSSGASDNSLEINNIPKITENESENSIIYMGTTYLKPDMPRKTSIIDLTKSDSILSWMDDYNLDDYDISGDNIIDELLLKDHVSSAASIFTIFPPQPQNVFSSPSEDLCVCQNDREPCCSSTTRKRNLSTSDITHKPVHKEPKRVASSKSKVIRNKIGTNESSDCIWKLKRSYPLTSGLHENVDAMEGHRLERMEMNLSNNLLEIINDLEKEFNITDSQHSALAGELNTLSVTSNI